LIKQILVVDDSRLIREAISKILLTCGLKKSAIACVENAHDALDFIELYPTDLIICGDNLIDLSASQLLKRAIKQTNAIRVLSIILQQPQRLVSDVSFINANRYRIIQKPFNRQTFLTHLASLTKEPIFSPSETSDKKQETPKISKSDKSQPTILVVDDESSNIDVAAGHLSSTYRIIAAKSGKQAIQIINAHYQKIDLILLDIMMPEVDGYQVCQTLKGNDKTAHIPIIFLTAKTQVADITKGFSLGAVDYITKPLQGDILLARVATHVSLSQQTEQLALQVKTLKENAKLREDIEKITQHDLKGPLSSILFELPKLDNEKSSQSIKQSVNSVLEMINRSLDIFKIEQGTYPLSPIETDLTVMVMDAINASQLLAEQKNITINVIGTDRPHMIWAEPLLCLSIYNNLIKNAIEAAPENSMVKILLKENELFVEFIILNQGVIPAILRENLFEKYVSSNLKQGSGFGTYSAKLMTEVQNGTITFDIKDEKATIFTVQMPSINK
jgi:CheY-like chemotaxis protein